MHALPSHVTVTTYSNHPIVIPNCGRMTVPPVRSLTCMTKYCKLAALAILTPFESTSSGE